MKKLNKKGFTLIELLAVIVLLAILAIAGGTAIGSMMNKSKRTNFVTAYNNVRTAVEDKIALGETIPTGSSNVASQFDLSDKDYELTIAVVGEYYQITLKGKTTGTYNNIKLNDDACAKMKGRTVNRYECKNKAPNDANDPNAPYIVGYVEQ